MQIALYLLQAVCYCFHLVIRLRLKSSTLLFYSERERHCLCNVPTCHIGIIACYYQQKLATCITKVCARSLLVKICLQVKMNLFFSDVIVTSVQAFAILYLNLVMETLHVHACHNDVT